MFDDGVVGSGEGSFSTGIVEVHNGRAFVLTMMWLMRRMVMQ